MNAQQFYSNEQQLPSNKEQFIKSQNYLSSSALNKFKNNYGDSLKGFDEKKIKSDLLTKGLLINEVSTYLEILKRRFIEEKYFAINFVSIPNVLDIKNDVSIPIVPVKHNVGGGAVINVSPCINEGFENTPVGTYQGASNSLAVTGWTLSSRNANGVCPFTSWNNGATEFSIVSTPILNFPTIGTIPHSPLGGTVVARLNNSTSNTSVNRLTQSFPVTSANTLFQFAYCGYWQDGGGGHLCCDQPGIYFKIYTCGGGQLACSSLSLAPGSGCQSSGTSYTVIPNTASWTNWQIKYVDLTPYIGTCVTIEIYTTDCSFGGHFGTSFFDSQCGGTLACPSCGISTGTNVLTSGPVSFCAGSGIAQIAAPSGYTSYQWIAPGPSTVAAPQGTQAVLTISNPTPGTIYTVNMVSPSGCQFVVTNTLSYSQVNIAGIASASTCLNGASGAATVIGNGSGTGYNYTWLNSTSSVVGTSSIANNLAAGVYSIILSGLGSSGCGTAIATTTVGSAPPGMTPLLKPYCGNIAYLSNIGGSNYRWYNNLSLITGTAGNVTTYTVNPATNNAIYYLSYLSNQGCQDSLQFTLIASPPGILAISNVGLICNAANNGTAAISMTPAVGAPPGLNIFNVTNYSLAPAYNFSLGYTAQNSFSLGGLSAGVYTINASDGSCNYSNSFTVAPYLYNYTVSPTSISVCPTGSFIASVNFSSTALNNLFSYNWQPNQSLLGNQNTLQNILVFPSTNVGNIATTIYSVTVTPITINCPITKTISVTAINPPQPTISAIPNMCDNAQPYQTIVSPTGGTFSAIFTGVNNPINNTGLIFPNSSGLSLGTNTISYAITVNTCQASQSATFQISHFNSAALVNSVSPLCVTSPPVNLMNIVQSTANGTWSAVQGVSNNIFSPAGLQTNTYSMIYNTVSNPNPSVCTASTVLTISVTNITTPTINLGSEFCTNASSFVMVANPPGGSWSGNVAINSSGVVTPSLASPNFPNVFYSVSNGPCLNTNSIALQISKFYPASFSGIIPAQCYNSNPFNLMSVVQSSINGTWYGNSHIINNAFNPSGLLTNNYILSYSTSSAPNPTLCPDYSTISVSVLNPPIPDITVVGPFCSNHAALQLSVSSSIGQWVSSSYINSSGIFTPSLCVIGNNPIQYVIGTNTCYTQQTKYINIEAFQSAAILSQIPNQCATNAPINLTPFTQNNSGIWTGSGITGTSFNPALVGSGKFVINYHTSSSPSGMCPDESTIAVNVFSLASPVLNSNLTVCNNNSAFQLVVSPLGGIFGDNFGAIGKNGVFNPGIAPVGNNIVTYSISSGPCLAFAQSTINVVKFISAEFEKQPKEIYCKNVADEINLDAFVLNTGGVWFINGTVNNNMFNPNLYSKGYHVITYSTNSIPSTSLCPDTHTFAVKVGVAENVAVTTDSKDGKGCAPLQIVFYPQTNVGKGTWNFGDGTELQSNLNTSHVYASPGTFTATFIYINSDGCESKAISIFPKFEVYENPKANFLLPEEILISNPEIIAQNQSSYLNTNKYQWFVDGKNVGNTINLNYEPQKIGSYQITLIAETNKGCKSELTKSIEVKSDFNVYVPSSFSPNYDGLNDTFLPVFSPYGLDSKTYELEIFDRWGHSLYKTKDVTKGWDGSLNNKGETLKEDIFIFKLKFKDVDGNVYNKMGHLTLIK